MPGLTFERLAQLQANYSSKVKMPGAPEASKHNVEQRSTATSLRSFPPWEYGPSGLSSPNSSVDGRDGINSGVSNAYSGSRGQLTLAQICEREELPGRHKKQTLIQAEPNASHEPARGVQITPTRRPDSHAGHLKNQGPDRAQGPMWPLTGEQRIDAYRPPCREVPNYGYASPYYSFEKPYENPKRSIDDSSSPEAKKRKTVSEDEPEDDDEAEIEANRTGSMNSKASPSGDTLCSTPQYAIAREVRKQSKQTRNKVASPTKDRSERLLQLQKPKAKPLVYSPYDIWHPDSIGKTHKMHYEPRTAEEKVKAWFQAEREKIELQELQIKEFQEQMSKDHSHVSWGDWGSNEPERHGWPSQVKDLDNVSEKSPSANSISSINSNSRSSTTTVSSDGDSPHWMKRKDSIGEATVQTASQVDNAPHDLPESTKELLHTTHKEKPQDVQAAQETQDVSRELTPTSLICETMVKNASQVDKAEHDSPVPAVELPKSTHTEKPEEALAAQATQDVAHVLAPAQAFETKTAQSQLHDGSETMDVSNGDTQGPTVSHDTRKDSGPGTLVLYTEVVDGLPQDTPKVLQRSESSKISQAPPADIQSHLLPEVGEKIGPLNRKKQKNPNIQNQGRKNQRKPLGSTPSKIEKPSARLTRSKAKTNHSTKFRKLDNAGKLPVDWTA